MMTSWFVIDSMTQDRSASTDSVTSLDHTHARTSSASIRRRFVNRVAAITSTTVTFNVPEGPRTSSQIAQSLGHWLSLTIYTDSWRHICFLSLLRTTHYIFYRNNVQRLYFSFYRDRDLSLQELTEKIGRLNENQKYW